MCSSFCGVGTMSKKYHRSELYKLYSKRVETELGIMFCQHSMVSRVLIILVQFAMKEKSFQRMTASLNDVTDVFDEE